MSDEEFVRENWNLVHRCDGSYLCYPKDRILVQDGHGLWLEFKAWSAAAAFTRDRLEEKWQLEEEIEWTKKQKSYSSPSRELETAREIYAAPRRILTRLNRDLAALKTGMKPSTAQGR